MLNTPVSLVMAVFSVAAGATALTAIVRLFAVRQRALVHPSERCSHTIPTPHGGGVAIAVMSLMVAVLFSVLDWVPDTSMVAFVLLGLVMVGIGVWDDFGDISSKLRLMVHVAVVILGMLALPRLPVFSVFSFTVDTSMAFVVWPVLALAWVWLINLYNFMDGIDGLAAVQAIVLFAGMAFNFWYFGFAEWGWICLFILAAVLGFAILNWPPAKIFMGDGGSGFLGFVIGFMMLLSAGQTTVSMWSWIILLTLFIADATVTLLVRLATGQNILQPHRLHVYQKLAMRFDCHRKVTVGYGMVMLAVLLPVSVLANAVPRSGFFLFAGLFTFFALLALALGAGRLQQQGQTT